MKAKDECFRCKLKRPQSEFVSDLRRKYFGMCKACADECAMLYARRKANGEKLVRTSTERSCVLCERILPIRSFSMRKDGTYESACRDCNVYVYGARRRAKAKK